MTTAPTDPLPVIRAALATVASAAATAGLGASLVQLVPAGAHPGIDTVVAVAVLGVGALAGAGLTLGCALLVVGAARPQAHAARRWAARLTPELVRRAVLVGLSAGLGLATAGPVSAAEADLGWVVTAETTAPAPPAPSPTTPGPPTPGTTPPEESGAPAAPLADAVPAASVPTSTRPEPAAVVVAPGDSLWSIAAASLPPGADAAQVAALWPRWYAANAEVIGTDPDLIHPGQRLVSPEPADLEP